MTPANERQTQPNRQIRDFINDIRPIFRGRHVFIADVGANVGSTFAAFWDSPLKVNRACLFEANPKIFAELERCVDELDAGTHATCLPFAVSDTQSTLTLHDMQDMSRVISPDSDVAEHGDGQVFEVDAKPLDDFRAQFPDGHISILKVDVEGHEKEVFRGAAGLLADHAVEFIYVEAGMDRDNPQQTHYRDIEDLLQEYGYRVFKIYEQTMEWVDDRPLLRRMNMAFVSPVVAEKYPYSLLKEMVRQDSELESLRETLGRKSAALDETSAKLARAHRELAMLAQTVNELDQEYDGVNPNGASFESNLTNARTNWIHDLRKRLADAERRVRDMESSTSWKLTAPLRKVMDRLRR